VAVLRTLASQALIVKGQRLDERPSGGAEPGLADAGDQIALGGLIKRSRSLKDRDL